MERLRLWPSRGRLRRRGGLLGGHVRVGFENNVSLPDGKRAATNADLVGAVARAIGDLGLVTQDALGLREEIAALMR